MLQKLILTLKVSIFKETGSEGQTAFASASLPATYLPSVASDGGHTFSNDPPFYLFLVLSPQLIDFK